MLPSKFKLLCLLPGFHATILNLQDNEVHQIAQKQDVLGGRFRLHIRCNYVQFLSEIAVKMSLGRHFPLTYILDIRILQ